MKKEQLLKELAQIYAQEKHVDIVDIYYRLQIILHDLKNILELKNSPETGCKK